MANKNLYMDVRTPGLVAICVEPKESADKNDV